MKKLNKNIVKIMIFSGFLILNSISYKKDFLQLEQNIAKINSSQQKIDLNLEKEELSKLFSEQNTHFNRLKNNCKIKIFQKMIL